MTQHIAGLNDAACLEIKSETGGNNVIVDAKKAVEEVMTAFSEYKQVNDSRLATLEKKGAEDPLDKEKLIRLDAVLDKFEGVSQKAAKAEATANALDELKDHLDKLETAINRGTSEDLPIEHKAQRAEDWARAIISAHIRGEANLTDQQRKAIESAREEYKALSVSADADGGYLAPMEYVREITKGVTEMSPMRSLARVRNTSSKSMEIPKRTGQFAAQWVAEQGTRSETTGLTYGLDQIDTYEFYALIDLSQHMLEDPVFDMQSEISTESTEQFSVAEGAAFVVGTGLSQPEGFLVNANVPTTNSGAAAAVTSDGIISLKYGVKTAYTANARFTLNRQTLASVRKLKDGNGQYIWMPGIADGRPNTIDGDPYQELPDMPNEAAGAACMAYGDFRRAYTWVDRIQMTMLRDPYTQATSGNIRFIVRKRAGGKVVLAEAIRKMVCAA